MTIFLTAKTFFSCKNVKFLLYHSVPSLALSILGGGESPLEVFGGHQSLSSSTQEEMEISYIQFTQSIHIRM